MKHMYDTENIDIDRLKDIFDSFNKTTENLRQTHEQLSSKVAELQLELEEKNRELARKEKLAALGQMAAGVAHEIRNPLGGIEIYVSMLARSQEIGAKEKDIVTKVMKGISRLNRTVGDLLDYTRDVRPQHRDCCIQDIVEESITTLAKDIEEKRITVRRSYETEKKFRVDPDLLQHVFLNIIINAVQACEAEGLVDISRGEEGSSGFSILFEDSGCGIPDEIIGNIFEPFFTKKSTGIGLGLSIVGNIIRAHGGEVRCGNREKGGAFFEIRIPGDET